MMRAGATVFAAAAGFAVISGSGIASAEPSEPSGASSTESNSSDGDQSKSGAASKASESGQTASKQESASGSGDDDKREPATAKSPDSVKSPPVGGSAAKPAESGGHDQAPVLQAEESTAENLIEQPVVDTTATAAPATAAPATPAEVTPAPAAPAEVSGGGNSTHTGAPDTKSVVPASKSPTVSNAPAAVEGSRPSTRAVVAGQSPPAADARVSSSPSTAPQSADQAVSSHPLAATAVTAPNPVPAVVGVVARAVSALLAVFGLGPAAGTSTPPPLWGLLEYARRQFQRTFLNQSPDAQPVQISVTAAGVVTGTVGASDYDGDPLTYRITQAPVNGSVVLNRDGTYVYTPAAALATIGGTDDFTVEVSDNAGFVLHLFDGNGRTSVPVIVTVPAPGAQTATIAVGDTPSGIAVSPNGDRAYVTNMEGNTVSVVDTTDNTVIGTIGVGGSPIAVAVHPTAPRAYVANFGGDSVSVIDTATNKVLVTIAVGDSPTAIALDPNGSRIYVSNMSSNDVSVIDTATNFVIATIAVGRTPSAVAVSPDGRRIYVANYLDKSVSVIDSATNAVAFTTGVSGNPSAMALSPDGRHAYITNYFTNTVSVMDTATGATAVVGVGGNPNAVVVSPSGARIFVTNSADDTVSVIDAATRTVVDTIDVGNTPDAVAVNPIGALVYVANSNGNSVTVIPVVADASRAPTATPIPALGSTRGFEVYNLTSQTLALIGYGSDKRPDKNYPPIGTTVAPGQSMHFDVPYRFLITDQIVRPVFSGPDGAKYNVAIQVGPFNGPGTSCSVSGGNGQQCTPTQNGPNLIAGNTVKLLDRPGTVVEFGPGQGQDQAKVLNTLCYEDSQAACSFTASRQIDTFGLEKALVSDLENESFSEVLVRSLTLSDTRTESDSVKVTVKVARSFLEKIVNLEISGEYGHTWTYTHTFTEQITIRQPPRTVGGVTSVQPVYRVFGDFTLELGDNTTYILRDVYFDTPNPNLTGRYRVTERPLDSATAPLVAV